MPPLDAVTDGLAIHAARKRLARGTASDHLAALYAYREYFAAPTGLRDARRAFAADHFLNERALAETRQLKKQMREGGSKRKRALSVYYPLS